jgi:prepilin-type N-terminal cleavage/methylation domain-containing protein
MNTINTKPYIQNSRNGFTLIELLVALAVLVLIAGAIFVFQRDFFSLNVFLQKSFLAQNEVRGVITIMVSELRSVEPSNGGAYALELASDTALAFYADVNDDGARERVHYYLSGNTLMKSIIYPSIANSYSTTTAQEELRADEFVKPVLQFVVASSTAPIFSYFDETFAGTTSPLVFPFSLSDIQHIGIQLIIDEDPNFQPPPIIVSSKVTLRNLKDN